MDYGKFNLRSYNNKLSPFGQKVLKVLVHEWRSESCSNSREGQLKESCSRNSIKNSTIRYDSRQTKTNTKCRLIYNEKATPIVPTPSDLLNLKTVPEENLHELDIVVQDDLLTSGASMDIEPIYGLMASNYNENVEENPVGVNHTAIEWIPELAPSFGQSSNKGNISWSNMFDSELLEDDTKINKSINGPEENLNEIPIEMFKKPNTKTSKRKMCTLTNERQSKREKGTVPVLKNIYRKENYTTTVKNWLNDVDYQVCPHDEVNNAKDKNVKPKSKSAKKKVPKKVTQTITTTNKEEESNQVDKSKADIDVVLNKEEGKKKVIQAQLANKDGKMKFGKPKIVGDDQTKIESLVVPVKPAEKAACGKTAKPAEKAGCEKKPKSKFIAPIKSQIPVKDVSYKITKLEESNASNFENELIQFENIEVLVVLVYRNGFCQMNGCYTEDTCTPEGLLISLSDDESFYYFSNIKEQLRKILSKILEQNTIICYDGKNIFIYLYHLHVTVTPKSIIDLKIGGALLNPENPPQTFSDLQKIIGFVPEFTIATDSSLQKVAWYTTLLRDCSAKLRAQLVENSLWKVFVDIEMQLVPIIADMESVGVAVDMEKLKWMEQLLVAKLKTVEAECHRAAGRSFQINSPPQVRALLYDELRLDTKCDVQIAGTLVKGDKSTSEETLRSLMSVHPLPRWILEYRHLHKAHSTFLTGIAQHVKDGVVRPIWDQTAAATGRIASNNPNLQAIPKTPFKLTLFPESEDAEEPTLNFRAVYVARAGCALLAADFRHVECRVLAHAAADRALGAALRSDDLFRVLAAEWLKKSSEEVTAEERERTKRVVYGGVYGCGARRLAAGLGVGRDHAQHVLASFHKTFPSLKSFGRNVVAQCVSAGGRLSTLGGRTRTFTHISSADYAQRAHAERQAVNFIIQGSAADACKAAMAAAWERLRGRARLLLQIHDELVWEVPHDQLMDVAGVVRTAMETRAQSMGAPRLPVALAAGAAWGLLQPLPLP